MVSLQYEFSNVKWDFRWTTSKNNGLSPLARSLNIRWEFLVEYMKPRMTFDNLYNEWLILSMSSYMYLWLFTTENNLGHSLQLYCFSSPWVLWCVFSSFESKNDLGHSLHWNGFSLVWEWVKWIFKLLETENDLEWKWNGLSFKWILRLTTRPSI